MDYVREELARQRLALALLIINGQFYVPCTCGEGEL